MGQESGRRALVIGAASGIGRATAERLHEDGYALALADLKRESLDGLAQALGAQAHGVDITDLTALEDLARAVGPLDVLALTAGLSMSMAPFARIMEVNLAGTARALKAFTPTLRPGGAVVCVASIAGHMVGPLDEAVRAALDDPLAPDLAGRTTARLAAELSVPGMAYGLSKHGVLRLVQREAAELGKRQLRICSISPGVTDTPMGELERRSNAGANEATAAAPIPRLGRPEEMAAVIAFLASPAASYVTGADVVVDGGWLGTAATSGPDSAFAQAMAAGRAKN